MKQDSALLLKTVKYSAMTLGALMLFGIATLMVLARGKGEDIAGIVGAALMVTLVASVVAIGAAVLQRRAHGP